MDPCLKDTLANEICVLLRNQKPDNSAYVRLTRLVLPGWNIHYIHTYLYIFPETQALHMAAYWYLGDIQSTIGETR